METKTILKVEHVTKRFLGTVALKEVTLELYQNEILSLIGENGAGKSTLMKILSGIYPVSEYEGDIYIEDRLCHFKRPTDSEDAGIAMIYQELNLELDLTVAENILLGRLPQNKNGLIDWKKTHSIAANMLASLNADIDTNVVVRSLSPSMQQIVCIARALVRNPKILILDEPTSVLTETETENLMGILYGLKSKGLSCIYISHKLDEVFEISDRIITMRDGSVISVHNHDTDFDSDMIIEDMIGRKLDNMYPKFDSVIGEELLRAEHFCVPHPFAYGKDIITDVSLTLHKGEVLALTGLVGSGRSELLNAIFGSIPKKSGKLFLNGKEIEIKSPEDAKKNGMGLVTEDRKKNGIIMPMSISDNLTMAILDRLQKGFFIDRVEEKKSAKEYAEKLRIKTPSLSAQAANLSGGNQQKVIMAKWLMTELQILFLDEPTRGIDVGTKAEIYKLIRDLASKGISIVMVSSEMRELLSVCDRFVVLGKGVVQAEFLYGEANEAMLLHAASHV